MIDWDRRTVSLRAPGWSVEFCEGEGPFLCVARGAGQVGSVELLRTPVRSHGVIAGVLDRGGSELEALEAAAVEFLAVLSADRRTGMGEDHHLRADPPAVVTVMGKPGLRLIVEGRLAGRVQERIVQYHVIERDTFYVLAATATDGDSPGDFAIADLEAFEPVFGEVAAASRVSAASP